MIEFLVERVLRIHESQWINHSRGARPTQQAERRTVLLALIVHLLCVCTIISSIIVQMLNDCYNGEGGKLWYGL